MSAGLARHTALPLVERADAPARSRAPAEACAARDLCVVLHDVSPARWDACRRVLGELERCAQQAGVMLPLTLLVVPRMHGDATLTAPYLRWLYAMRAAGHELALHGLTHRDEGPPALHPLDYLKRRFYTASEGEFAALSRKEARHRLREAREWMRALHLPMEGFVAPAWLMSGPALKAVAEAGFKHTCTLTEVISLPHRQAMTAPSLVFSTRSGWRRRLSVIWNNRLAQRSREARLLRLELHPGDADHPEILHCWRKLLQDALRDRVPVRLAEAAQLARRA